MTHLSVGPGSRGFIGPITLQKAIEFESKIQTRPVLNLRLLLFLTMSDKMVPGKMFDSETED